MDTKTRSPRLGVLGVLGVDSAFILRPMRTAIASLLAAAALAFVIATPRAQAPVFDLVIRNGRIVDGTGSPWYLGDVAVRHDTIVRIAPTIDAPAARVIDAAGKVVEIGRASCRERV